MAKPIIAALLCRLTGAPLIVASAYPVDLSVDNLYPDYAQALGVDAEHALGRVAAIAGDAGVAVRTMAIPAGESLARAVYALAETVDAKMLVIGSARRWLMGRVLPSAVTDRLLHGAPCPVAVAPTGFSFADADAGLELIGVAFTDTPDGHAAVAMARALAGPARAAVRVLTVADPLADGSICRVAEAVLRRGIDAVPHARSAGGEILSGHPADALAAASEDFGLLVCGARGYGPVRTVLLGATSHSLVRKAGCPVLVVAPGTARHEVSRASISTRVGTFGAVATS
jgi:nucleotide-binding universal stress UspA family protein